MSKLNRRGKLRFLIHTCVVASLAIPAIAQSQEDVVEEVIVTGSYIRNSAFAGDANVNTVSQADLLESGTPSMANYIRELSFTQNTNIVSNVLGSADGAQDSIGASFNLRGLGENSTLQLVDGVRTIDQSINNALPDLAIERLEVVLDGGSATYGSDAVAGVVNLIPIKEFEGFRARTYYQVDEDSSFEDIRGSFLWGHTFDNGIRYVGAFDAKTITPLMQFERPREWEKDNGSSSSGNPGAWREIVGADPTLNLYAFHNGTSTGGNMVDPACETFNENAPAHGKGKFNTPSGVLTNAGNICRFEYTKQFQYSRENTDYLMYNSFSWDATDWLSLNFTANNSYRITNARSTSTTATSSNNRKVLLVREDHPANPFGVDVSPWNYRLITEMYTHRPSHLENSTGARTIERHDVNNRFKFSADFDLAGSWTGHSYYMDSEHKYMEDSHSIHLGKLQLALEGLGGPNGNEYWNPFGSADPRSPDFVEGVTDNSLELTDWLFNINKNSLLDRDFLDIFETRITGELFDMPFGDGGAVLAAFGYQWRDLTQQRFENSLDKTGADYNTAIGSSLPFDAEYVSETRAVFAEFEFPILETLTAKVAVRYEDFVDYGIDATTPKIALRWEALPTLALRASWGESFLAPTPEQARPFIKNDGCIETFRGIDPFTGLTLTGTTRCSSGNPGLQPETSTITNFGLTWQPDGALDGLEVSLDYQEIEYVDRIRVLTEVDTMNFEFQQMLAATGISEGDYDTTAGSATRLQAEAWYAITSQSPTNAVDRFEDFELDRIYRKPENISSVWIDLIDAKVSYDLDTNDYGSFTTTLQTTYFDRYEFEGLSGGIKNANGMQNANSSIAPPLPKFKTNIRVNWFMGNHSASVAANMWSEVKYDDRVADNYGDGWTAPPGGIIDGETRVNARYTYVLDRYFDSEITISGGVTNVFDTRPQRLPMIGGFESRLSTPWGRQFWLSLDWAPNF
ncbi:MAG: TonB-dependent receptor [Gammaproteobacteria bacterium]|nr:TonB-dependent receptor [Gammaproteobacteria bacterium]